MKKLIFLSFFFLPFLVKAQTNILDSYIDWSGTSPTIIIFLSDDTGVVSLTVDVGTSPGSNDLFDSTLSSGSNLVIIDNRIELSLGSMTSSENYYVTLQLTLDDSTEEDMEYLAN